MLNSLTAHSPATLAEAFSILAERQGRIKIMAGGTDLMVLMNARQVVAPEFLDLWRVSELRGITDEDDTLRIGALTTYTQLISSPLIQQFVPALVAASRTIGAMQIQNRGTIGGNIVNASPAGDSLPVLAAYDAEVLIGSARGLRQVSFNQFYAGYRKTVLAADELLLAMRVPKRKEYERDFFFKVGTRRAQAISKVMLAARANIGNGVLESISLAVGSVAPTVIRAWETERLLEGKALTADLLTAARASIIREVSPITDVRSTEHYRRTVTGNVLVRFLRQLMEAQQ